jgi:superfamily II DNA or RNA helicase
MIRFGSGIFIKRSEIISRIEYALRQIATFSNPKYYELQRMRFPTWGTPRYISLADREKDDLFLPRGLFEKACEIFLKANADITVSDERPISPQCDIDFSGILDEKQIKAVETLLLHENGLLVAPPGSGKTVMACALIAQRNVPTLVLVHRDQLVTQWIEQLTKFLKIKKSQIGVLGGTRKKLKGMIDIAMLQTVSRREDSSSVLSQYGLIIIDECHHIPAVSFESTLRNANVRYIVGLTATPYRKDGLHPIISMHCGPVRYEIKESRTDEIERTVIVRASSFKIDESSGERPPIHIVWDALVKDEQRLSLIARDVAEILSISRFPVILSDRKEHLSLLHEYIQQSSLSSVGYIITGDMGEKERASILDKIKTRLANDEATFILSTGSLLGEGFDFSECDTLFIAMPISFKGRVIQYAGRLHRSHEGKEKILIYDYVDCNSGLALSMFKKRISAYREMGYIIELPDNESICRIVARTKIGTRKTSITEYGKYSR